MSWTDDKVEKLKDLWSKGFSCSQIAVQLGGGITRNAVIGKVSRLGLAERATIKRSKSSRVKARPPANKSMWNGRQSKGGLTKAKPAVEAPAEPYVEVPTNEIAKRKLVDLAHNECRWPIGDPRNAEFGFCGDEVVPFKPYCEGHCKRAFSPLPVPKRKTENPVPAGEGVRQREGVS